MTVSTVHDPYPRPPGARLSGWRMLAARPADGWVRIGLEARSEFRDAEAQVIRPGRALGFVEAWLYQGEGRAAPRASASLRLTAMAKTAAASTGDPPISGEFAKYP